MSKFSKSVTEDEFNEAFSPFTSKTLIDGQREDIEAMSQYVTIEDNNCMVNLCWRSYFANGIEQVNHYISWLETAGYLKSPPKRVSYKADAVKEFFMLLKDKLDEYKEELETVANPADSLDMI